MLSHSNMFRDRYNNRIKMLLVGELNYAQKTFVLGASNKMEDIESTCGWVFFPQFRYNRKGMYVKREDKNLEDAERIEFYYDAYKSRQLFVKADKKWFYHSDEYNSSTKPVLRIRQRFPEEHSLADPGFPLKKDHLGVLAFGLLAAATRSGNCVNELETKIK